MSTHLLFDLRRLLLAQQVGGHVAHEPRLALQQTLEYLVAFDDLARLHRLLILALQFTATLKRNSTKSIS